MSDRKLFWAVIFGSGFEVSLNTDMGPIESPTDSEAASLDSLLGRELLLAAEPTMGSLGTTSLGPTPKTSTDGSFGVSFVGHVPGASGEIRVVLVCSSD